MRFERSLNTTLEINRRAKKTLFNKCGNIYIRLRGLLARGTPGTVIYLDDTLGRRARKVNPLGSVIKEQKNSEQVRCFVGETPQCSQFST